MVSRRFQAFPATGILCFLVMLLSTPAHAQRLPQTVKPEHYRLTLTPNLKKATFAGQESIDVEVEQAVDSITLNAAEIKFISVTAMVGGREMTAKVTEDAEKEQATFHFGERLPVGKLKLMIRFDGILNNELRGFYLSKTAKRNYAVTQFESTDARRAFPCFDEPAMKATFSVTLVVDKADTAISNTNIVSDKPDAHNPDKHEINFAETPRMSTYLVAFLVGDFKCLTGSSDGVPIRACATPDQVQNGAYALSAAEYVLHYYDTYFGIKYPMPKLDMIAIPDFEAGAMENFGAITYRETDLLLDPSHASAGQQRNVGLVVAHEMAHQWFGDMVTMEWWDNIWLNEGFASWMENKPIAAWKPEFNIPEEVAVDNQGTLNLDSERITRTIRAKADTPAEINEMFDGISYGKAGSMLLMVENYLGEQTFRQGVHQYLAAHMYGNATAEDFWSAQTEVSHKPIDKIMNSLVSQPGVPLLTFGALNGRSVPVVQSRFFLNSKNTADADGSWTLPICLSGVGQLKTSAECQIISDTKQTISAPEPPYFVDAGGKGYYRFSYPGELYSDLAKQVEIGLSPVERISLVGNQWALTQAGKSPVDSYLNLIANIRQDTSPEVIGLASTSLNAISIQVASDAAERKRLSAWVRAQFIAPYEALGEPSSSDSPSKRELRARLLTLVAGLGEDPQAIAVARKITDQTLTNDAKAASVSSGAGMVPDPTIASDALRIAARSGDADLFNRMQMASESSSNPQFRSTALHALALFRDPALEKRALDYAVSGKVRNQDAASLIGTELRNRDTQDLAWQYVKENWDKVQAQFTTFGGASLVASTGSFCSADRLQQIDTFFKEHKVKASERTLARSKDAINDCMDLRAAQEGNLRSWLAGQ